ncbi:MAG: AAA family ATPase, partial [Bacteroidaceae bacterium]|nr:AAA family ATPase [Bacteroidaceae bacterium]
EHVVENKNVADPYEDMREVVSNCGRTVFCLHHLSALSSGTNGKVFLHMLEEALMTTPHLILMLMGTQAEVNQVMEDSPLIACLIRPENRFHTERYSVREQIKFLENYLLEMEVNLTSQAEAKLADLLVSNQEMVSSWRKEELTQWWAQEICPRFMNRLLKNGEGDGSKKALYNLEPEDICLPLNAAPKDEFEESVRELNAMVGLDNLKQNMNTLFNRSRFDKMRREAGLKVPEKGGYHMIFTGNPGTGKTTVAKLVGQVYHSLGLLSKGGVIVTERTKLVGRYLGETEKNMAAVLEQAKGNVLFIDEAYSLCDNDRGDRRDFGCRVLESLLTVLAQKNPDMIVIMAGYEKEMNQMLEMNPGMKGRFPYKFKFEDYNADELFQIANALLAKSEYVLTPMAELRLKETIEEVLFNKDAFFHNARWVEQYILDGVVSAMSDRLMSLPFHLQSRELLQTIEVQDIEMAYQKMKPQPLAVTAPRKRIGFVA